MSHPVTDSQPLNAALAAAQTAINHLIEVTNQTGLDGLTSLPDDQLLSFAVAVERLRNRMLVLDRPIIRACETGQVAEKQLMRSTARLLEERLLLTRGEARQRVATVHACGPRLSMTGEPQPPKHPVLAQAQEQGRVGPEQTKIILGGLEKVEKLVGLQPSPDDPSCVPVGPEHLVRAERDLVGQARYFTGRDLAAVSAKIVDVLNPDGDPDLTEAQERQRGLHLQHLSNGLTRIHSDLLPDTAQLVKAVLTPLARPASTVDETGDGETRVTDARSREQRWHDALHTACRRLLDAGGLPVAGGVPATVIVTIDEDSLRTRTGAGTCPDGTRLPIETVLAIADQAHIIPTVLSASGAILKQGRTKRIATTNQTLALYARDAGCTFPGCGHPPDWCERHHIIAWTDGGQTNIDNLTLLCSYHHRRFAAHGWTCTLIDGLPHWIPPAHHDPQQTPQLHERLRARAAESAKWRARTTDGVKPVIPVPTSSVVEAFAWTTNSGNRVVVEVDYDLHRPTAA